MATEGDLRQAKRLAERLGWTLVRRGKHGWLFARGEQRTMLSSSPSDQRSLTNFKAQLKRPRD